jgi:hypothetical protein
MNGRSTNSVLMMNGYDFLGQRKQAKVQWLQDPNQNNLDNPTSVIREVNRHFRGKNGISES